MVQKKWWAPQKLAPQVVGTPKHTPQSPLPHTSILLPLTPPDPLSLPGPLRTSWGLRKPWEPLEAFGSLGSSVRLRGLASLAPPHLPSPLSLPLAPYHPLSPPLSLPRPPWVPGTFLGPREALGAFTSLWQPLAALGLQSDSGTLLPLLPITPSCSLLPPEPP